MPSPSFALLCCDQPGNAALSPAEMNANLVCPIGADSCSIAAQTLASPPTCAVEGCQLDFGNRVVSVDGTFTLSTGTLGIRAKTLTINKPIAANGARTVELTTTGTDCANGIGHLAIRQPIDVSSTRAGIIRLASACGIGLEGGGQLLANSSAGAGGTIDLRAATTISQVASLRATGSGSDGGVISLRAGDDVLAQRPIDVRSLGDGEGGSITLRAGDQTLMGTILGGALTVSADLIADGSPDSDGESGEDGGAITLEATGPVLVTTTATMRANGGTPDGAGGIVTLGTQAAPIGVLTPLDGDVTLLGPIILRGATTGDGGDLDGVVGRAFHLQGTLDMSGGGDDATAGNLIVSTGGDLQLDGAVAANGRVATSTGGYVDLRAGMASAAAVLTAAKTIDVSAGSGSDAGDVRLAACRLTIQPNVLIDARSTIVSARPAITLAATTALTLGAGSRYLAPPSSGTLLVEAPATTVMVGAGVTFNPPAVTTIVAPGRTPFPPCPVCGDGIRQPGEPCDPGSGADGTCCSGDCLHLICTTPTPSPTPRGQDTGSTTTPTRTVTPTVTLTPTPTATATPGLPPIAPRAVLSCERALAKGSSRLATTELGFLEACHVEQLTCLVAGDNDRTACLTSVGRRCQSRFAKLTRARQTLEAAFTKSCAGDPPTLAFALMRTPEVLAFATLDDTCAADVGIALTSPSAVLACVERATCAGERALAIAAPHLLRLLPQVFDPSSAGLCLTPPSGDDSAPVEVRPTRAAVRCQRAIVTASRKLLTKQLAIAHRCVDSLLGCRLNGTSAANCSPIADRCAQKLAALSDTTNGTRARLAATLVQACSPVPDDALVLPTGLGFNRVTAACLGLGAPAPTSAATLAPCLGTAYGCAAGAIVRRALPLVDRELARVGLALGDAYACPVTSPTPTATATRSGPASTPTPHPTPTVVSTASPSTLVVPGGGNSVTDCVAEWLVVAPAVEPPPTTHVTCTDGDQACDVDGEANDVCQFTVGLCLAGTDPRLPDCPAAGITSYVLQSPQPGAGNDLDARNAAALLTVLSDLLGSTPGGAGQNGFAFSPPLVLTPPNHCTALAPVAVERRGLPQRTERFRTRTIAAKVGADRGLEDRDTLLLTCVAPNS